MTATRVVLDELQLVSKAHSIPHAAYIWFAVGIASACCNQGGLNCRS